MEPGSQIATTNKAPGYFRTQEIKPFIGEYIVLLPIVALVATPTFVVVPASIPFSLVGK